MTLSRSAARHVSLDDDPRPRPLSSLFDAPSSTPIPTLLRPPTRAPDTPELPRTRARLYPGTRIEDIYDDPFSDPRAFDSFTSSFAPAEYLAHLVLRDPTDLELITRVPTRAALEPAWDPVRQVEVEVEVERAEVDELVWVYEHLRKLVVGLHAWVATIQTECRVDPSRPGGGDCAEMRASEWLYLCAAHKTPPEEPCTALSYIAHVLDGSSSLLTSTKYFPSRAGLDESTRALLATVSRRLYRCFSHTY
ncbi:hypothetical protein JCM11491_003746, partial [Sporobolomyces phaffii]